MDKYGLKMVGIKEASGATKVLKDKDSGWKTAQIKYNEQNGEIGVVLEKGDSYTSEKCYLVKGGVYEGYFVSWLPICITKEPLTMQEIADKVRDAVKYRYRSKEEVVDYFKRLAYTFGVQAHRNNDLVARGKAEAYEKAAFEVANNLRG